MAQITITINSREYAVVAEDGQETNLLKLAAMLDEKAKLITSSVGQINENMLLAMIGLIIADELNELRKNTSSKDDTDSNNIALKQCDNEISDKIKDVTNQINSIVKNLEMK